MVAASFWSDLDRLRASAFATPCRVVVMVRVREPFSWYCSFYDWAVRPRQRTGDARWGMNFTDWLPYNMQARYLLHGTSGTPSEWAGDMAAKRLPGAPHRLSPARWAELMHNLRARVDILAPLERLDDALKVAFRLAGFLTTLHYQRIAPSPVRGPWDRLPHGNKHVQSAKDFCLANRGCRAAVRAAAADDHRLYHFAVRHFDVLWSQHASDRTGSPDSSSLGAAQSSQLQAFDERRGERRRLRRRTGLHRTTTSTTVRL